MFASRSGMKLKYGFLGIFALLLVSACDQSDTTDTGAMEEDWTVSESVYVNASPEDVWELIGDYYDVHSWHPGVISTQKSGSRGANVRILILGDGNRVYEELTSDDPDATMYAYKIVETPLPVTNYSGQLSVVPEGEGSRVTWSSRFDVEGDPQTVADTQEVFRVIFLGGLNTVVEMFNKPDSTG